jgi:hypothetical protein
MMNIDNDLNAFQASRDDSAGIAAAPHQAEEPGQRFVVPWRLNADTVQSPWQHGDEAGCGQVAID